MKKTYFLPRGDSQRSTWLRNFNVKLPGYASKLGITKEELLVVSKDTIAYDYVLDMVTIAKTFEHTCSTQKTSFRNCTIGNENVAFPVFVTTTAPDAVPYGIFTRISNLVKKIKASDGYLESIGKDLGIIGTEMAGKDSLDTEQPLLTIKIVGGFVQIKYTKGAKGGIVLESRRGAETDFTLADKVSVSTYKDKRANLVAGKPEQREFRAWFTVKDEIVGIVSPVVTILV